jgi:hypothetical protein
VPGFKISEAVGAIAPIPGSPIARPHLGRQALFRPLIRFSNIPDLFPHSRAVAAKDGACSAENGGEGTAISVAFIQGKWEAIPSEIRSLARVSRSDGLRRSIRPGNCPRQLSAGSA